jgi:N,N'-diacetylbacillosaminyl-diphospho-undecaprenol alpha-1,3-N-acetylgalactosaminyltransferase
VLPLLEYLRKQSFEVDLICQRHHKFGRFLEAAPCRVVYATIHALNPFRALSGFWRSLRFFRESRPDILHAHLTVGSTVPLLAAWIARVPVRIYHNHGFGYLGQRGLVRKTLLLLEKINITLSTHVLAVSPSNLREITADGLLRRRPGSCLGSGSAIGIDTNEYSPSAVTPLSRSTFRAQFQVPTSAFVVGFVGRPCPRKGFNDIIHAWSDHRIRTLGLVLMLAGANASDVKRAGGTPSRFLIPCGFQDDIRAFYASCDVVALPSHHEGFGSCLLEAAAMGKPLIGTDIPGIRCSIRADETGLLVPVGNTEKLVDAIVHLFKNPDLARSLGHAARERAVREFQQDRFFQEFLELYGELMGSSTRDSPSELYRCSLNS